MPALQRLQPLAASGRTHADCHQAVAGPDREPAHGGQLHEVQRSFAPVAAIKADPITAPPGHEQVLTTRCRPSVSAHEEHECSVSGPSSAAVELTLCPAQRPLTCSARGAGEQPV